MSSTASNKIDVMIDNVGQVHDIRLRSFQKLNVFSCIYKRRLSVCVLSFPLEVFLRSFKKLNVTLCISRKRISVCVLSFLLEAISKTGCNFVRF